MIRLRHAGAIAVLSAAAFAVLAFATLTLSHAQLATSPWPMFHHDPAHTGLSPYSTSANPGTLKWKFTNIRGEADDSSPAIGTDGTIYIGAGYWLYAINPGGTQKWAFEVGAVLSSPAIGADGTIYIGSEADGNLLYAVNPNGTKRWALISPICTPVICDGVISSPAIGPDGTIYFGDWPDGNLYAVTSDGTQKWAFATAGAVWSSPAIGTNGTIYVGDVESSSTTSLITASHVYAINPSGTQKWAFLTGSAVYASPTIGADGTIYVNSEDGNLYALTDGGQGSVTQKWAFPSGGTPRQRSVLTGQSTPAEPTSMRLTPTARRSGRFQLPVRKGTPRP